MKKNLSKAFAQDRLLFISVCRLTAGYAPLGLREQGELERRESLIIQPASGNGFWSIENCAKIL